MLQASAMAMCSLLWGDRSLRQRSGFVPRGRWVEWCFPAAEKIDLYDPEDVEASRRKATETEIEDDFRLCFRFLFRQPPPTIRVGNRTFSFHFFSPRAGKSKCTWHKTWHWANSWAGGKGRQDRARKWVCGSGRSTWDVSSIFSLAFFPIRFGRNSRAI